MAKATALDEKNKKINKNETTSPNNASISYSEYKKCMGHFSPAVDRLALTFQSPELS